MRKYLKFVKKHGNREVLFKNLPLPHKLAIIRYMAIEGEAWECPSPYLPNSKKTMDFYVKKYGNCKFGVVDIPTDVMKEEIMSNENSEVDEDFETFESYHKWYIKTCQPEHHSSANRWPCIIDSSCDDIYWNVLEDGWHRLHSYIRLKHDTIPCIYYLPKENYKTLKF